MGWRSTSFKVLALYGFTFFLVTDVAAGVKKASKEVQTAFTGHIEGDVSISGMNAGSPSVSAGGTSASDSSEANSFVTKTWSRVLERLASDGFDQYELRDLFSQPEIIFDPSPMVHKMNELYSSKLRAERIKPIQERLAVLGYRPGPIDGKMGTKTRRAIIAFQYVHGLPLDGTPAEDLLRRLEGERRKAPPNIMHLDLPMETGPKVYRSVLQPERIREAKDFLALNEDLLRSVHRRYGISPKVAVSLLALETRVGNYLGEEGAFATLSSMAACADFSKIEPLLKNQPVKPRFRGWLQNRCQQKADWAYKELKALLRYAEGNQLNLLDIPGSKYGAIGICQFMPTNALIYGIDGDGDGKVDLFTAEDALPSMGNFLRHHGWKKGMGARKALYRYNRNTTYVNTILALAEHL